MHSMHECWVKLCFKLDETFLLYGVKLEVSADNCIKNTKEKSVHTLLRLILARIRYLSCTIILLLFGNTSTVSKISPRQAAH